MQRSCLKLHLMTWIRDVPEESGGGEKQRPDLQEMIALCKENDRKAQKGLFDFLAPKMYPVCIRYVGDRDTAQDILQDGFITLFAKLDSYSGEGSFEGWARKIFVNTALMYLRKTDALKLGTDISEARSLSSDSPTALQHIGYKDLMRLVAELPPGFRTVFNMYVVEGYSHKEIGEALGISENTSRSQLQRARKLLQDKIKDWER